MGLVRRRHTAFVAILLACAMRLATAADFELTPEESKRVESREIVVRAALDPGQRKGTARIALLINAAPSVVFELLTRCKDVLQYAPHLQVCRERSRAPDGSWALVEHEVDFGWYAPRIKYVFRADFEQDLRIRFHQVSGDFRANEGLWELEPVDGGARTLLRYRVYIDPPGYIPNWLARSTFKRELPKMLTDLRKHCEAEQLLRAQANLSPH